MMFYIKQNLIAIDQYINALFGGYADETISARAYRMSLINPKWNYIRKFIDSIFFFDKNHCRESWIAEYQKHQLPPEYTMENINDN